MMRPVAARRLPRPGSDHAVPSAAVATNDPEDAPATAERGARLDQSRLHHLVGYAASRASIELKKQFARHLGPLELKAVEFSILVLVEANGDVNQKQLGDALEVSAPNMAVTLDRMVERGWVERVRSTVDRRAMLIRLTPPGRGLVQRAEAIARTMEDPALTMLSPAERALLIELLLKVAAGGGESARA